MVASKITISQVIRLEQTINQGTNTDLVSNRSTANSGSGTATDGMNALQASAVALTARLDGLTAEQVADTSSWPGLTVKAALDDALTRVVALENANTEAGNITLPISSNDVTNAQGSVTGTTVTAALGTLRTAVTAVEGRATTLESTTTTLTTNLAALSTTVSGLGTANIAGTSNWPGTTLQDELNGALVRMEAVEAAAGGGEAATTDANVTNTSNVTGATNQQQVNNSLFATITTQGASIGTLQTSTATLTSRLDNLNGTQVADATAGLSGSTVSAKLAAAATRLATLESTAGGGVLDTGDASTTEIFAFSAARRLKAGIPRAGRVQPLDGSTIRDLVFTSTAVGALVDVAVIAAQTGIPLAQLTQPGNQQLTLSEWFNNIGGQASFSNSTAPVNTTRLLWVANAINGLPALRGQFGRYLFDDNFVAISTPGNWSFQCVVRPLTLTGNQGLFRAWDGSGANEIVFGFSEGRPGFRQGGTWRVADYTVPLDAFVLTVILNGAGATILINDEVKARGLSYTASGLFDVMRIGGVNTTSEVFDGYFSELYVRQGALRIADALPLIDGLKRVFVPGAGTLPVKAAPVGNDLVEIIDSVTGQQMAARVNTLPGGGSGSGGDGITQAQLDAVAARVTAVGGIRPQEVPGNEAMPDDPDSDVTAFLKRAFEYARDNKLELVIDKEWNTFQFNQLSINNFNNLSVRWVGEGKIKFCYGDGGDPQLSFGRTLYKDGHPGGLFDYHTALGSGLFLWNPVLEGPFDLADSWIPTPSSGVTPGISPNAFGIMTNMGGSNSFGKEYFIKGQDNYKTDGTVTIQNTGTSGTAIVAASGGSPDFSSVRAGSPFRVRGQRKWYTVAEKISNSSFRLTEAFTYGAGQTGATAFNYFLGVPPMQQNGYACFVKGSTKVYGHTANTPAGSPMRWTTLVAGEDIIRDKLNWPDYRRIQDFRDHPIASIQSDRELTMAVPYDGDTDFADQSVDAAWTLAYPDHDEIWTPGGTIDVVSGSRDVTGTNVRWNNRVPGGCGVFAADGTFIGFSASYNPGPLVLGNVTLTNGQTVITNSALTNFYPTAGKLTFSNDPGTVYTFTRSGTSLTLGSAYSGSNATVTINFFENIKLVDVYAGPTITAQKFYIVRSMRYAAGLPHRVWRVYKFASSGSVSVYAVPNGTGTIALNPGVAGSATAAHVANGNWCGVWRPGTARKWDIWGSVDRLFLCVETGAVDNTYLSGNTGYTVSQPVTVANVTATQGSPNITSSEAFSNVPASGWCVDTNNPHAGYYAFTKTDNSTIVLDKNYIPASGTRTFAFTQTGGVFSVLSHGAANFGTDILGLINIRDVWLVGGHIMGACDNGIRFRRSNTGAYAVDGISYNAVENDERYSQFACDGLHIWGTRFSRCYSAFSGTPGGHQGLDVRGATSHCLAGGFKLAGRDKYHCSGVIDGLIQVFDGSNIGMEIYGAKDLTIRGLMIHPRWGRKYANLDLGIEDDTFAGGENVKIQGRLTGTNGIGVRISPSQNQSWKHVELDLDLSGYTNAYDLRDGTPRSALESFKIRGRGRSNFLTTVTGVSVTNGSASVTNAGFNTLPVRGRVFFDGDQTVYTYSRVNTTITLGANYSGTTGTTVARFYTAQALAIPAQAGAEVALVNCDIDLRDFDSAQANFGASTMFFDVSARSRGNRIMLPWPVSPTVAPTGRCQAGVQLHYNGAIDGEVQVLECITASATSPEWRIREAVGVPDLTIATNTPLVANTHAGRRLFVDTSGGARTLTLNDTVPIDFDCEVIRIGANAVNFSAGGSATITGLTSLTSDGQRVRVIKRNATNFVVG